MGDPERRLGVATPEITVEVVGALEGQLVGS
jgi:hypothetical protein